MGDERSRILVYACSVISAILIETDTISGVTRMKKSQQYHNGSDDFD